MTNSLLVGPKEAANLLGIGRNRLYGWLRAGILPSVRDGGRLYIARRSVEVLADQIARGTLGR